MLFQTFAELKAHVGGGVNVSVKLEHLTAAYQEARDKHLERYLGDEFLDELEAVNVVGQTPTATQTKAIQQVGRSLALLTLYEWSVTSSIEMTSKGATRQEGDNIKGAYKYQVNDYKDWYHKAGLNALDNALRFCEENKDDLTTWNDSEAAAYHRAVLIQDARQLRQVHNQPADRMAYEALRPLLFDIQEFVFVELLGREQLEELLTTIVTPSGDAAIAAVHKALVQKLRRAQAAFAVYEALRRNVVIIEGGRIMQREALEPQSTEKTSNAPAAMINLSAMQSLEFAERHLSAIRVFLTANKEHLPLYVEWLEANQPDPDETYPNTLARPTGRKVVSL
jgi:hypothetical protein